MKIKRQLEFLSQDEFHKIGFKYKLLDRYFDTNNFQNGRYIKKFFGEFCKQVFDISLLAMRGSGYFDGFFTIASYERHAYASIASALTSIGFHTISEYGLECSSNEIYNKNGDKQNRRRVDFWTWNDNLSVVIECKSANFNISKNFKSPKFDGNGIDEALKQIYDIKKINGRDDGLKIALLLLSISCKVSTKPSDSIIAKAPRLLEDELYKRLDGRRKMGVLCATLDMREALIEGKQFPYELYSDDWYCPYMVVAGILIA